MTPRERFLAALLRKGEPDRVPLWELIVNEPTLSAWGARDDLDFVEREDLDAVTVFESMHHESAGGGLTRDEWGVTWRAGSDGVTYPVAGPVATPKDLLAYRAPDPADDHRLAHLREAVKRFKGKRAIVFLTHDGFEFAYNLRGGMESLFADWIEDPPFALAVAEAVIEFKIGLMRRAIEAGADAIVSGDDYATAHGPLMSLPHFRRFVLPSLKRSIAAAHALKVPYIKHTDGEINALLPDMVEAGIDAIDPIEPAAGMDIGMVKTLWGNKIAVVGNVDCSFILPGGTEREVEEAVLETIAKASPGGGHVLASSNTIHPGVRPENYRAMVETARRHGRYPIDPALVARHRGNRYMDRYRTTARAG